MADEIDQAKETEEQFITYALANRREPGPLECGECLNCGNEIDGSRWCDTECRDQWQEEQLRYARVRGE
jgi:hypothetical protein